MHEFQIDAADKASLYNELIEAADAMTEGEPDGIANMANVAALLFEALPDVNWAGFYRNAGAELVLGPFQGRPACIRIPFGQGVCGTAAASLAPQLVADVHAFPGHIVCDAASRAELVVPILLAGRAGRHAPGMAADVRGTSAPARLIGLLDLDSPTPGRFDGEDMAGCVKLIQRIGGRLGGMAKGTAQG